MSPLFKKLNLKDQTRILVLRAPESFAAEQAKLGEVEVHRDPAALDEITFCLGFVTPSGRRKTRPG